MTKEELQNKVAVLEEDNRRMGEQEQKLREDISKVLGSYTYNNDPYSHRKEKKLVVYSWAQIFAELGKLLAARTFYDLEGNVSECEFAIKQINESLEKLFEEKRNN